MILPKHPNTKITKKIGRYILNNHSNSSYRKLAKELNISHVIITNFLKLNNIILKSKSESRIKWSIELLNKTSLKYFSLKEFYTNEKLAYQSAVKRKLLPKITKHMVRLGNKYKRLVYIFTFTDNSKYVGLTFNFQTRYNQHKKCLLLNKKVKSIKLTKYMNAQDALILEEKLINKFTLNGIKLHNKGIVKSLGGNSIAYTKSQCKLIAKKCKTRKEFKLKHKSHYNLSVKQKWLNDISKHMPDLRFISNNKRVKNITTGEVFESMSQAAKKFGYNNSSNITGAIKHRYAIKNNYWEYVK